MSQSASKGPIYYSSFYHHGVDEKRRVQVPAKWRPEEGEVEYSIIVWPKGKQPEACLLVLPPELWVSLVEKLKAMPFADPNAEALRRVLGRNSDRVTLDKAGRMCLPENMAKAAGIEKEAVLVGLVDRFEVWNPERYAAAYAVDEQISVEAFKMI